MKGELSKKGVYIIINIMNTKVYIGSTTTSFRSRFSNHKKRLRNGNHYNEHLQNAWNKYGKDAFVFKPLEVIEDSFLIRKREKYYIDFYNACNPEKGYNINSETEFHKVELSTKEKLSKITKKMWKDGKLSNKDKKGKPSWNKGLKCDNISLSRRNMFYSIGVYYEDTLMCIFRSATDLEEWSKNNTLPHLLYSIDKQKRETKGKKTSFIRASNIHRAIRLNKKLRGLTFKKLPPLSQEIGIVQWVNCWKPEMVISSQAIDTSIEGSETT